MARARSPARDKAYEIYKQSQGKKLLKDIATDLDVSDSQIRKWKNQDKWDGQMNGNATNEKGNVTNQKKSKRAQPIPTLDELIDDISMSEKQRLFCIYYVKSFNATQSAIKAGYSADTAHVQGPRLLGNVRVREEIRKVKAEMRQGVFIDAMDILDKYIRIAFADITDFVTYGKREIEHMGMFGPVKDEDGRIVMKEVNYVDFKESTIVDGTIISEVKQGKDGISIKLADKMKALEMLTKYFDLLSENDKKKLQEEKLKTDIAKSNAEIEKLNGNNDEGPIEIVISRKGGR
jgi:phage terminase small subunit